MKERCPENSAPHMGVDKLVEFCSPGRAALSFKMDAKILNRLYHILQTNKAKDWMLGTDTPRAQGEENFSLDTK